MKTLKKEFTSLFYRMSVTRDRAEVWRDIVFLWAAAINNRVHYKQKIEDAYLAIIQKYTRDEQERIAEMLAIVAADMARNSIWRNGWATLEGASILHHMMWPI